MCVTDPFLFISRLKINHETNLGICVYSLAKQCRKTIPYKEDFYFQANYYFSYAMEICDRKE